MALFRTDYSGRGELSERQQKVSIFLPGRISAEFDWKSLDKYGILDQILPALTCAIDVIKTQQTLRRIQR